MIKKISVTCLLLFLTSLLIACQKDITTTIAPVTTEFPTNEVTSPVDQTIYLQADVTGAVTSLVAVNRIRQATPGLYVEYGDFRSAANLSGTSPVMVEQGRLLVPVLAESTDYYYRATLNETVAPPCLLSFSYEKEGIDIDPLQEKGGSGSYAVDISIAPNPEAHQAYQNSFLVSLQLTIPATGTTITDSGGAMVLLSGGSYTVSFLSFPGMTTDARFAFDTVSFAITSVQATFIPFDPALLGSDMGTFASDIEALENGLGSLKTGLQDISDGMTTLSSNLVLLKNGLSQSATGIGFINAGVSELASALTLIKTNYDTFHEGLLTLQSSGLLIQNGYDALMLSVTDVVTTFSALHSDDVELMTKLATLSQTATAVDSALSAFLSGLDDLCDASGALSTGLAEVESGLQTIADQLDTLSDGVSSIDTGLGVISGNLSLLPSAIDTIISAIGTMQEGLETGHGKLAFLYAEPSVLPSFTSNDNPAPGQLQFIYSIPAFQP